MGNKFSITIILESGDQPIVAGKTLKGTVVLKVNRRLNPTNLVLYLLGKETTIISKATKGSVRDAKIIARAMTTLFDAGRNKIERGIHTIPFSFVLPPSLPSSTQFPKLDARSFNGKIEYRLRAQLGDSLVERVFTVVSAPLPSDVVPCMVKPQTHELKRLGVLNKGCLSVGVSAENSRIGRGQTLKVSVASRNDTSLNIVRVQLKLVELIEYRSHDEEDTTKIDLEKLKDIDLPGLQKERTSGSNLKFKKNGFVKKMESTYRAIYKDLVSSRSQIDLVVPKRARDSYNGNLMTISHYVKVTFFTKAMIGNPSLKLPIVIGNARDTERRPQRSRNQRPPGTPIATVLVDEEIPETPEDPCDESTITVGTTAGDIPVANAIFFDEMQTNSLLDNVPTYPLQSTGTFEHNRDSKQAAPPRVAPMPSAPDEAVLRNHRPTRFGSHVRDFDGRSTGRATAPRQPSPPDSPQSSDSSNDNNYSPYRMYTSQLRRPMPTDYSYEDSDVSTFQEGEDERSPARWTNSRQPLSHLQPNIAYDQTRFSKQTQPNRDAESRHRLNRLIHELRGSIHDYEVVATYARHSEYRTLFSTLSPVELGIIMSHVNMNHQVKVARLVARQMSYAQAFTCAHCAEAVKRTSEYFRSNMVEALLPFCEDLTTNRHLIQHSLSEWDLLITDHLFDGLYEC